jgi:hypothetical protein
MENKRRAGKSASESPPKSSGVLLPETHIVQDRYSSYSKAAPFIKHLHKKYLSEIAPTAVNDEAFKSTYKFQFQVPGSENKYRTSQFPKAKVCTELLTKQEMLNAYNTIGNDAKSRRKARNRTMTANNSRIHKKDQKFISYKTVNFDQEEKCKECGKRNCRCKNEVHDSFLEEAMKKHLELVQRTNSRSGYQSCMEYTKEISVDINEREYFSLDKCIDDSEIGNKANLNRKSIRKDAEQFRLFIGKPSIEKCFNMSPCRPNRRKISKP